MEKRIKITPGESENVQMLYSTYISYMNILQFFMNNPITNQELFDRKWEEAVQLNIKLDEAKRAVEKEYKPAGEWDRYEFDFDKQQVVFIKNA